ncbi:MAG: TonB-dependent receptor [Cryomorphaceae bacterium]|nr:TonB-dependent receptor [Cryomorphaceae bacterium]
MKTILTFLFIALSVTLSAQNGVVKGRVIDSKSKEAIIGANILAENNTGVSTDINGDYILNLLLGEHKLRFSFIGYTTKEITVSVSANQSLTMDVALESVTLDLDFVVISAGKFEQDLGEVTVSMEVLKPNIIENKNTTSVDDILQQTPGVSIVDNEPQIRSGSGYSFGAGSRVMILMDDLPILSGDAGRPSWGFLPVENIEQIEIIKGASSVLYGSSALSGVINLRTAYPKDKPQTKITAYHGMYSDPQTKDSKYWQGQGMQSGIQFLHSRKIGNLDFVIGGNFMGDDGSFGPTINTNANGVVTDTSSSKFNPFKVDRYDAESRARMNVNLRYHSKKTPGLQYGINTNWLLSESLATLIWDNDTTGLYQAYAGSATRTKQLMGTVDPFVQYYTKKGGQHSLRGRWQKLDNDNDNDQGNFSDVFYGEYQYQQNFEAYGLKDFTTTFGLVGINTFGESQLYNGDNPEGKNTAKNYASYLQLDKSFFDRLTLSAGVRYEYYQINTETAQKPVFRSGINYRMGQATFLRASYGQGFRFPSIAEKYIQTAVGQLVIFPGADLLPETSYNAEFGVKQGFKIGEFKGFIDGAVFIQEYNNFIEFTFGRWTESVNIEELFGFGFRSVNTGKSRVTGYELSVLGTGKLGKFTINTLAGYTYTKPISTTPDYAYADGDPTANFQPVTYLSTSSNTENNILKYRIQHLARADVELQHPRYLVGLSYRFQSAIQNIDEAFIFVDSIDPTINWGIEKWLDEHTEGIHIFDARLGYFITESQRISIIVQNVTNLEYAIRPLSIESPRLTTLQYTIKF